ncbi:MAG: murein L,D-transpeptidase, partial [Hyphomicrobiales bacterium]|nr:murein L,D-transpeptidase [Hyphomicrobiales bacterium]
PPGAAPAAPKPVVKKPVERPRETALSTDPTPTLQPETFSATAQASERYAAIADAGGWPLVPAPVQAGAHGKHVAALRQRLAIEGDLPAEAAAGDKWDGALALAVKSFQGRHGLKRNGIVAGATLAALNVPARERFRQLASSAQRLAATDFAFGQRYVVVNIPSTAVEAIENGKVARRYAAVVGDVKHPSPQVSTRVVAVNLSPTWTAPTSIIRNEIIPKMRKDPGYLARARIRILDAAGAEVDPRSLDWSSNKATNYTLRQDSGAHNALGAIRINMPNAHSVYMHDTPSKRGFMQDYRFLSHGCVRVEGVYDLAQWLLEGTGKWTKEAMLAKVNASERADIRLSQPVPVAWVYLTGWASADGVVHFRNDVYGVDRLGEVRTAAR